MSISVCLFNVHISSLISFNFYIMKPMTKDDKEICPIKSIQDSISSISIIKGTLSKRENVGMARPQKQRVNRSKISTFLRVFV